MQTPVLHYIYDPLCGWCYAAAPVVYAVRKMVTVRLHGGGMMFGASRQPTSLQLRGYLAPHIERITRMSGQEFGAGYVDGLLARPGAVLDSAPPTAAVIAADNLGGRGLDYLDRLQQLHYREGQQLGDAEVLAGIASDIGLDAVAFADALARVDDAVLLTHIRQSRALMHQVGGTGFPTCALERGGRVEAINLSACLGRPAEAVALLMSLGLSSPEQAQQAS